MVNFHSYVSLPEGTYNVKPGLINHGLWKLGGIPPIVIIWYFFNPPNWTAVWGYKSRVDIENIWWWGDPSTCRKNRSCCFWLGHYWGLRMTNISYVGGNIQWCVPQGMRISKNRRSFILVEICWNILGKFTTSLFSLTGIMVNKGNHPKMALFQVTVVK